MDIAKKIARIIYPHFRFGESRIEDSIKLVNLGIGGFCLYGGSKDEIIDFIRTMRSVSDHPLIFLADYENGAGQWVEGATKLPSNMAIAASQNAEIARRKGEITAIESDALGVDWVLAPVLDIANNHSNPIVNLRAFSDETQTIISFAKNYISGLRSFNVLNSIKHFPGHGDTSTDSHLNLPEINKSIEELEKYEMIPFKSLLELSDSVMVGHLMMKSLDSKNPASLSKNIITSMLRNKFNYDGVVITDALMMKAIKDETESGVRAFVAGADILLYPEDPLRLYHALNEAKNKGIINDMMIDNAIRRQDILVSKRRTSNYRTKDLSVIGCNEHRKFVEDIAPKCISWVKKTKVPVEKNIFYFETLMEDKFKGEAFIKTLKESGFEFKSDMDSADVIIISSFSKPKAFSGSINLSSKEKEEIDNILRKGKKTIFISFGSPFVFDDYLKRINSGICCFTDIAEFQVACARALKGELNISGTMPVKIYE